MGKHEKIISKCRIWGVDFLMILVILGTQDKKFPRLLEAIDNEIEKGTIKDRVVVQAGQTQYSSNNMEIFDFVPAPEFDKLLDEADLIITHGGAGSILTAIKKGKTVIAAARLAKYKEHHNDHQKQIIKEFANQGYILELKDFQKLEKVLEKSKTFKPKKFESNTQNMVKLLEDYIEETNHVAWYHKYHRIIRYGIFGILSTIVNILSFSLFRKIKIDLTLSNILAWILSIAFSFITCKFFVFNKRKTKWKKAWKEAMIFLVSRILSLGIDMGILYLLIHFSMGELPAKIISSVVAMILNYGVTKFLIFKKEREIE